MSIEDERKISSELEKSRLIDSFLFSYEHVWTLKNVPKKNKSIRNLEIVYYASRVKSDPRMQIIQEGHFDFVYTNFLHYFSSKMKKR